MSWSGEEDAGLVWCVKQMSSYLAVMLSGTRPGVERVESKHPARAIPQLVYPHGSPPGLKARLFHGVYLPRIRSRAGLRLLYAIAAVPEPGDSVFCGNDFEDFANGLFQGLGGTGFGST